MAEDEVDVSDLSDIEVSAHVHLFEKFNFSGQQSSCTSHALVRDVELNTCS